MPEKQLKRIDTLAKILECDSMCVAVACVKNNFIIAANEFHAGTKIDKGHCQVIAVIMEYLKQVATNGKVITKDRDQLLQAIYYRRFLHKKLYPFKARGQAEERQILFYITTRELARKKFDGRHFKQHEVRLKGSTAHTEMLRIYKSIKRLEDGILASYNSENDASVTAEQLNAFKNFNLRCIYVKERKKAKGSTHAEMQLLSYLLQQKVEGRVYLGISKSSCLDCHCMFNAAEKVLKDHGSSLIKVLKDHGSSLILEHKKDHDGNFSENWCLPDDFSKGHLETIYPALKKEYLKQKTAIKEAIAFYQYYSDSESSVSSDIEVKQQKYSEYLDQIKTCFEEGSIFNPNLCAEENIKFINFGKELIECGLFEQFYDINGIKQQEIVTLVEIFINIISKKYQDISIELLVRFFKSPYFPKDITNGEDNYVCQMLIDASTRLKVHSVNIVATQLYRFSAAKPQLYIKFGEDGVGPKQHIRFNY